MHVGNQTLLQQFRAELEREREREREAARDRTFELSFHARGIQRKHSRAAGDKERLAPLARRHDAC